MKSYIVYIIGKTNEAAGGCGGYTAYSPERNAVISYKIKTISNCE